MPSVKNRHGRSVHDPFFQNKIFLFYFFIFFIGQSPKYSVDSLRSVLWSASEKYCGQSPIRTLVSLREVLWTISENYFFLRSRDIYIYSRQCLRIICILGVPSNPKHKVDHFHALTPMSCDALCINAMQVSLHVISCYMYATCNAPSRESVQYM